MKPCAAVSNLFSNHDDPDIDEGSHQIRWPPSGIIRMPS